jgi:hypothetical protein
MKKTLRILIILNWATAIAGVVASLVTRKYLPPELASYLSAKNQSEVSQIAKVVIWVEIFLLIVSFIDSIGLFLLRRWAKRLLVPLYVVATALIPTASVYIQTGWTRMLLSVSTLIGGIIIGVVFFSPLAAAFNGGDTEQIVGPERRGRVS